MKSKALLIGFMIFIVLLNGCKEGRPPIDYKEEFENLNKCYSDQDCIIGQQKVGRDLASPSPECMARAVVDEFDNWFESKNQLVISQTRCFCDLNSNTCYTQILKAKQEAPEEATPGKEECEDGFILREGYCQPRILDITSDASLNKFLEDSIWIRGNPDNGEVKNFLNNQKFVLDVQKVIGSKTDKETIAKKIANWIKQSRPYGCDISNLNDPCYEHSPVNNMKTDLADFEYIYDYPEGVCFDAAVLTAAALRVANIPAMVHMEIAGGFHANVLAYINNEWVKIDSTFCTQQQIDSGFCKDASYIKKSAYSVHEIWEPIDDEYCRRDGFCMKAPGIPTSNEILSSSKSLPLVTIIYPRFFQLADAGINIICMGSGWNLGERANHLINQGRANEVRDAYITYLLTGDEAKRDYLEIDYLPKKPDFSTVLFSDLPHIGYFKAKVPKNILFLYRCTTADGTMVVYKDVLAIDSIITADDLIKTDALSNEDFIYLKQKVMEHTKNFGIQPNENSVG